MDALDRLCSIFIPATKAAEILEVDPSTLRGWYHRSVPYAPPRYRFGRDYAYRLVDLFPLLVGTNPNPNKDSQP